MLNQKIELHYEKPVPIEEHFKNIASKCELFGNIISFGRESFVYEYTKDSNKVIKLKLGCNKSLDELDLFVKEELAQNNCLGFIPLEYVGWLYAPDVRNIYFYYPVFLQAKITIVTNMITDWMLSLGYEQSIDKYGEKCFIDKNGNMITDVRAANCGFDEDGNFKLIDINIIEKAEHP